MTRVVERNSGVDIDALRSALSSSMSSIHTVSKEDLSSVMNPDADEIAFRIVETYFKEVARYGMKKQLTLDEIINAYLYSLARVKRKESAHEVARSVKEAGMSKQI